MTEPKSRGEERIAAWRALLFAHSGAVKAIESELAGHGLIPLSWYDVLLELNAVPDRQLRMQDLSDRVVLSRTRVSRLVDELIAAGLVERVGDPDDGRAKLARITPSGRAQLRKTAPRYLAGIDRHFSSLLTRSERDAVTAALTKVAERHRR